MSAPKVPDAGRGRLAERPRDIPRRGLKDVALRVRDQLGAHHVSLLAAGVGLFALLAAFPALAALISIYGLFASPSDVTAHLESLSGIVPGDVLEIFRSQLGSIAEQGRATLGFGLAGTVLVALWGARKGMAALMQACNIAYGEPEGRGFLLQIAVSLLFTLGAVVYFIGTVVIGAVVPLVLDAVFQNTALTTVGAGLRWVLLWGFVVLALALVYRYAPARRSAQWRWVSWGSVIAATLWVAGGVLFELYVRNFGSYGETYGALGGVVVLLLWLYLSGFIVILGAEINAELEHQTGRDTTVPPDRRMGERGAYVADTLGELRG